MTKVVLKDFFAEWCGPCQMQKPIIEEAEKEMKGKISVEKINIDTNQPLTEKYGVRGVPTIIIEKDGKLFKRFNALTPKEEIINALEAALK